MSAPPPRMVASPEAPCRRWPAEWEPHRATWLSWPHNTLTWPGGLAAVEDAFCEIVGAILPDEVVEINVLHLEMAERGSALDYLGLDVEQESKN